mmetsp:Transcript_37529/g.94157  ORF Transcript_37529/g.94157 Transcript_37529/m.94157 type:complete len:253 (+) Transcript_37529:1105-1863(+)
MDQAEGPAPECAGISLQYSLAPPRRPGTEGVPSSKRRGGPGGLALPELLVAGTEEEPRVGVLGRPPLDPLRKLALLHHQLHDPLLDLIAEASRAQVPLRVLHQRLRHAPQLPFVPCHGLCPQYADCGPIAKVLDGSGDGTDAPAHLLALALAQQGAVVVGHEVGHGVGREVGEEAQRPALDALPRPRVRGRSRVAERRVEAHAAWHVWVGIPLLEQHDLVLAHPGKVVPPVPAAVCAVELILDDFHLANSEI